MQHTLIGYISSVSQFISPSAWREREGLNLHKAAGRFGVAGKNPARTWQRWETGERSPPVSVIAKMEVVSRGAVTAASWDAVRQQHVNERKTRALDNKAARASGSSSGPTDENQQSPLQPALTGQEEVGA